MHETVFKIGCTFHHVIWELKLGTLCYLWHNPSSLLHNLVLAEHLPGGNTIRAKSYSHQSEIRKGKMVRSNVRLNLWRYPDTQIDQWISHHSYYNSDCEVNGYLGKIQAAYGTGSTTWPFLCILLTVPFLHRSVVLQISTTGKRSETSSCIKTRSKQQICSRGITTTLPYQAWAKRGQLFGYSRYW